MMTHSVCAETGDQRRAECGITKKCTGVAGRAEFEINVAGGNPVILGVIRLNHDRHNVQHIA